MKKLHKRIERLERVSGGDFQTKVGALALRLGVPAESLFAVAKDQEAQLSQSLGLDDTITSEGFCYLRQLGLWAKCSPGSGADERTDA